MKVTIKSKNKKNNNYILISFSKMGRLSRPEHEIIYIAIEKTCFMQGRPRVDRKPYNDYAVIENIVLC